MRWRYSPYYDSCELAVTDSDVDILDFSEFKDKGYQLVSVESFSNHMGGTSYIQNNMGDPRGKYSLQYERHWRDKIPDLHKVSLYFPRNLLDYSRVEHFLQSTMLISSVNRTLLHKLPIDYQRIAGIELKTLQDRLGKVQ